MSRTYRREPRKESPSGLSDKRRVDKRENHRKDRHMVKRMMKGAIILLALGLSACMKDPQPPEGVTYVFTCYESDQLRTEIWGVANAYLTTESHWQIHFTNGDETSYLQRRGEYCGQEAVRSASN